MNYTSQVNSNYTSVNSIGNTKMVSIECFLKEASAILMVFIICNTDRKSSANYSFPQNFLRISQQQVELYCMKRVTTSNIKMRNHE